MASGEKGKVEGLYTEQVSSFSIELSSDEPIVLWSLSERGGRGFGPGWEARLGGG